jgi:hypothetical protein
MADTALNDMKGRLTEIIDDGADLQVIPLSAKDVDATFEDGYGGSDITSILGGGAVERTTGGWSRKTHLNAAITSAVDDTADLWRIILDVDDTWGSVTGGNDVVALLICEVGAGDGTDRVIGQWDFVVTTDGNDVTANYDQVNGIWTAA